MDLRESPAALAGAIESVIYQNAENGYTVLRLRTDEGEEATVVGCLPFAAPGETLELEGKWTRHPAHGTQFAADRARRSLPSDPDAIYDYLASGTVKGVGPATAMLIVEAFGSKALEVLEQSPEKLAQIRGITAKKAQELSESFRKQTGLRRLLAFLSGAGLAPELAMTLYKYYGDEALEKVRENPYILAEERIGGTFVQADGLALELGFEADAPCRVSAAILYELIHNADNGHCFIPREKLIAATVGLIDVESEPVSEGLEVLIETGDIVQETVAGLDACYLARLHRAETGVAAHISRLAAYDVQPPANLPAILDGIQGELGISLAQMQLETVAQAARRRLMVITGGPGTGKTTSVLAILALYRRLGVEALLAAPTGRAAKRMEELTGHEAATLHRLLECRFSPDGGLVFGRDADDPLECGAVILDECSMVDITLMHALLEALPEDCRLVLVGDADQLPAVGPGNVFSDIIRSEIAYTVRLTEIFRQGEQSRIVRYAHMINRGEQPDLAENRGDFFFLRRAQDPDAAQTVVELCVSRLPKNMGIRPMDIQILTPQRKTALGTHRLNRLLQEALNPPAEGKREKPFGEIIFREGDRVMQIRNNYDILWKKQVPGVEAEKAPGGTGVFNGDVGQIQAIDPVRETMTVLYDDKAVTYAFDQLIELEHAFAMTVHKAQGSEYKAVILALGSKVSPALLHRGLLYTAVTRARELLVMVGDEETPRRMIESFRVTRRYAALRLRLTQQ